MNCRENKKRLVAWIEGELAPEKADQVVRHLESCAGCAAAAEEMRQLRKQLFVSGEALAGRRLDEKVMDRIFREQVIESRHLAKRSFIGKAGLVLAAAALLVAALVFFHDPESDRAEKTTGPATVPGSPVADATRFGQKIDDWLTLSNDSMEEVSIKPKHTLGYGGGGGGGVTTHRAMTTNQAHVVTFSQPVDSLRLKSLGYANESLGESFGFSVGGAKDIANFRENIENGFLPLPTDVTCEGLYYDYFFDTNDSYRSKDLFFPSYLAAVTRDPFSKKEEYYLAVGLNSGMQSFSRKKLNLVVVLDTSGSMESAFDEYYYDGSVPGRSSGPGEEQEQERKKPRRKIDVACESLKALLDQLKPQDRFGMVVFSDQGRVVKPLRYVGETDMDRIREHIDEIEANGSTNMADGMRLGFSLCDEFANADPEEYENRIIFLTDAQPNCGETSEKGLLGTASREAERNVNTTFIGIGVDFNTELVEAISRMRGANYYSVHSAADFRKRLVEEFEFMVTPLVFDLQLNLESAGYLIEKVYGSPGADEATGSLLKIHTLFPSRRTDEKTRGGVVLLKLSRKEPILEDDSIFLSVDYEDRSRKRHRSARTIRFADGQAERFDNKGIRKAVLLARYSELMRNWLIHSRARVGDNTARYSIPPHPAGDYLVSSENGIIVIPRTLEPHLSRWERSSLPLDVDAHYLKVFAEFRSYFESEMEALGDSTLQQEIEILERLGNR